MQFDSLSKVLIKFLSQFLDSYSVMNFSSCNKKYKDFFSEFRNVFIFLNKSKYIQNYQNVENKKELFFQSINKKDFSALINEIKKSPLHCACEDKDVSLEFIEKMIDFKCDINFYVSKQYKSIGTPLCLALYNKNISLLFQFMFEKKADYNINDFQNSSPLSIYCRNEKLSIEIVKLLT